MTNIISSLGGGSGIDTQKLVDDLIAVERSPAENILDRRQAKLESQISGYGALRSTMSLLQDSLGILADPDTFNARNVNFPDTNLLTPTAVDPEAALGEYNIKVLDLAASHSLSTSDAALYEDLDAIVGNGTLTFNFGDWNAGSFTADDTKTSQVITIDDSNNTLAGIRDAINDADFGVLASVIDTGSGYQLQITAPSGANNELEVVVAEGSPAGLSALSYTSGSLNMDQDQEGNDASLVVNGLSITRESNQVDDVIKGLKFTLNNISPTESVNVTISGDQDFAEQSIRDFVDSYNEFLSATGVLVGTTTNDEDTSIGSLNSDAAAKSMISQVRNSISRTITGLSSDYNALATVGITTNVKSGELEIDEELFSAALEDNYASVIDLFTPSNSSSDSRFSVVKTGVDTVPGDYQVVVTTDPTKGDWVADNAVDTVALPTYQTATNDFSSTLTVDATYNFKISVDGTESDTITLTGSFDTIEEVRSKLQSLINGDANLSGANAAVDVSFDEATDKFTFTSRAWGSDSAVSITASDTGMVALGIDSTAGTETVGVDVAGTIDGEEAFGAGNVLLPQLNSNLAGLSMKILPGAASASPATITLSQGFGNQLNSILNQFLESNGLLDVREENINEDLDEIDEERSDLDDLMERRRARLEAQFLAMERIISSLNLTSDSLDGLIDRLPFTATNN